MKPFVLGTRFSAQVTFATALFTITAGCYGNPKIGGHDAGSADGNAGAGGTAGSAGSSGRGGIGGTGGSGGLAASSGRGGSGNAGAGGSADSTGTSGASGAGGGPGGNGGSVGATGGFAGVGASGGLGNGGKGGSTATAGTGGATGVGGAAGGMGGAIGHGGSGGAAGAGGRGGSGGGGAGKGLGQSCGGDVECGSGHCANGVCCDQACTGVCKQCSSAGVCQMPADDTACGTITCPTDTTCRDYASAISTNRCKALGQCKVSGDCAYVNAPPGTLCWYVHAMTEVAPVTCDGIGACRSPTVKCGGDGECALDQSWCCGGGGRGLTCQVEECGGTPKLGPYLCDEKADCAPGYVCCVQSTPGGPSAVCLQPSLCVPDAASSRAEACNPATIPSECSAGTCQPTTGSPAGWYVCR